MTLWQTGRWLRPVAIAALALLVTAASCDNDKNRSPDRVASPEVRAQIIDALLPPRRLDCPPDGSPLPGNVHRIRGTVEGNGSVRAGYEVSLYASYVGGQPSDTTLATTSTDASGAFELCYRLRGLRPWQRALLFVITERGPVMLASALDGGASSGTPLHSEVVVNERTTVAAGTAFAQFVRGGRILGNTFGMINAVKMAENMANPVTGAAGEILSRTPNGTETSTYPTFNSLANVVAACVADNGNCQALFAATTPGGGPAPDNVLQAIANIARYPATRTIP